MAWPLCPTLPIHPISTTATFSLFPWMKLILKGKHFADVEDIKQEMTQALKGIKINEFKNCFEQWKKMLWQVHCIKWRVLWRWLKFKNLRIHSIFINIFRVFLGSLLLYRKHSQQCQTWGDCQVIDNYCCYDIWRCFYPGAILPPGNIWQFLRQFCLSRVGGQEESATGI